jgi:hypothetical protein
LAVFGERGHTGFFLVETIAGAVLITAGSILLARSSLLDPDSSPSKPGDQPSGTAAHGRADPG